MKNSWLSHFFIWKFNQESTGRSSCSGFECVHDGSHSLSTGSKVDLCIRSLSLARIILHWVQLLQKTRCHNRFLTSFFPILYMFGYLKYVFTFNIGNNTLPLCIYSYLCTRIFVAISNMQLKTRFQVLKGIW